MAQSDNQTEMAIQNQTVGVMKIRVAYQSRATGALLENSG